MIDNKIIGERIKRAREAKGLSLAEFARPVKIDTSRFSKIERGIEGIGLPQMSALAEHHGINLIFLVTGDGEILHKNMDKDIPQTSKEPDHLTAGQIFHMYMKTIERQDTLMEAQTEILKDIRKGMARADAQARIETNSIEILAGVKTLTIRQKAAMAENKKDLAELKSQKRPRSLGSGRKSDQSDGEDKRPGKRPRSDN